MATNKDFKVSQGNIVGNGFRAAQGVPSNGDGSLNGYAFGVDGDTGLFSPGSGGGNGALAFFTNNTERVRLTAGGQFGIGTSAPSQLLTVVGTTPYIRLEDASGSAKRLDLSVDSTGVATIAANQSAQQLVFQTVGAERMRIDSSGNVGVGAVPVAALNGVLVHRSSGTANIVVNSTDATMYSSIRLNNGNAAPAAVGCALHHMGASYPAGSEYAPDGSSLTGFGSNGLFLNAWHSTGTVKITTASVERMRIDSSGNVGVGTTAPGAKLDVNGQLRAPTVILARNDSGNEGGEIVFNEPNNNLRAFALDCYGANVLNGSQTSSFRLFSTTAATTPVSTELLSVSMAGQLKMKVGPISVYSPTTTTVGGIMGIENAADTFTVDTNKVLSHYGLTWKSLSDNAELQAHLSSYGGLNFYAAGALRLKVETNGAVRPGTTQAQTLGSAAYRWSTIYSDQALNVSSDERLKHDIQDITEVEARVATRLKSLVKTYRLNVDPSKKQVGVIAQEVVAAFAAEGLDALDYSIVSMGEDGMYAVCYDPLIMFMFSSL